MHAPSLWYRLCVVISKSSYPTSVLTPEECERLVLAFSEKSTSGARNRAIVSLAWRGGLRHSELVALKPGDYNAVMNELTVWSTSQNAGRRISLDPETNFFFALWMGERTARRKRLNIKHEHPVFCTIERGRFGEPLSENYIRNMIDRGRKKAGISKKVYAESLRDARAVELRYAGFSPMAALHFLGDRSFLDNPRYGPLPAGDFSGTHLEKTAWLVDRPRLKFLVQGMTLTPRDHEDQELTSHVQWTQVVADRSGAVEQSFSHEEVLSKSRSGGTVEEKVDRLERRIEELTHAIETLTRLAKGGDS